MESALGQPLRASIAYALAPNEKIGSHCIFLRPVMAENGIPAVRDAAASVANGAIRLTGSVPIREPMINLQLSVDCPGVPRLTREYVAFVDPASPVTAAGRAEVRREPAAEPAARPAPAPVRAASRPASPAPAAAPAQARAPISGSSYRVQPGDTLSGIADRIRDRDVGLWEAVDVIFAANPEAFIDNDRNLLRAGAVLVLPNMGPVAGTVAANARPAPEAAQAAAADAAPAPAPAADTAPAEPVAPVAPASAAASPAAAERGTETPAPEAAATEASDSPFVTPIERNAARPDRAFGPARETIPETPVDAAATRPPVVATRSYSSDGLNSLAWLGGAGIAIILGLLFFGRQLKERFGRFGDVLPEGLTRGRRRSDADETRIMPAPPQTADEPYQGPVRVQPVTLDADLETGSGFDDDGDIDVAQDFGFSTSRDLYGSLDMEFTEEAPAEDAQPDTDAVTSPHHFADAVIVEKEVPPGDDTSDYDLSMIVDATRQPIGESEDTTKDLKAIQVDTDDDSTADTDAYTLSREIDYKILEQDYEDELTATQAMARRDAELALRAGAEEAARENAEAATNEYALVDEELTQALPGSLPDNDDFERTAEMPLNRDGLRRARSLDESMNVEVTTELPAADNDETVAIDVETSTVDTKKLRAS